MDAITSYAELVLAWSGCDEKRLSVHDWDLRQVHELLVFDADCRLFVPRRRVACLDCWAEVEEQAWLDWYSQVMARLAENVARLCRLMPVK